MRTVITKKALPNKRGLTLYIMKKLISYRFKIFVPFGDGEYKTVYEMTIEKSYLFGLFKKIYCVDYELPMHANIGAHIAHWDFLVSSGAEIK